MTTVSNCYRRRNGKTIGDTGIPVVEVSEFTGSPEILGGRVNVASQNSWRNFVQRDRDDDQSEMAENDIAPIDLIVVAYTPSKKQFAVLIATCVENIDIGGLACERC